MKLDRNDNTGSLATTVFLLSPIVLIGAMLLTAANGQNACSFAGEVPLVLGLCAPAAYLLVRRAVQLMSGRLRAALAALTVSAGPTAE